MLARLLIRFQRAFRRAGCTLWVAAVALAPSALAEAQSTAAFADEPPPARPSPPARRFALPPPHQFRLDNGLRFLVQRDARQPLFAFVVSYEVGQRDDPPGYEGLAHLVEHLSFRGSRHLGPYQAIRELEKVGVLAWNGATTPDNTVYHAVLPAQYLSLPFWLESERMGFTLERFSGESLALELATVRKEFLLRLRMDEVELALWNRVFPEDHPYRVVEVSDAHRAGLSDVKWFFQAGYRPDKATIVVVGDVEPTLVESLARQYFGPIPNPPISLVRKPTPLRAFPGRERLTISRWTGARRLIMLWPAPVRGSQDDLTLRIAVEIARGARASIGRALRKAGLAEGAQVGLAHRDDSAFLVVEPVFDVKVNYEATEYAIEKYMFELDRQPPSPAVLKAARDAVRLELMRSTEDPLEHAWQHLDALRHGGRPFELSSTLARLDAITAATVSDFARRYFSPYHRFSTWYGDLRFEPTVPLGDSIQYEVFR
jgi:zinc protease